MTSPNPWNNIRNTTTRQLASTSRKPASIGRLTKRTGKSLLKLKPSIISKCVRLSFVSSTLKKIFWHSKEERLHTKRCSRRQTRLSMWNIKQNYSPRSIKVKLLPIMQAWLASRMSTSPFCSSCSSRKSQGYLLWSTIWRSGRRTRSHLGLGFRERVTKRWTRCRW